MDKAVQLCDLKPAGDCITKGLMLDGSHNWSPTMFIRLIQDFGLDSDVSRFMVTSFTSPTTGCLPRS